MTIPAELRDPRWARFNQGWRCASCGETHTDIFSLACFAPDNWQGPEAHSENHELTMEGDFLSEDLCVVRGEHFYVRCVFDLPLVGTEGCFSFGVWSSLSRASFNEYIDTFDSGFQAHLGPWFGWFSNRLLAYPDTYALKTHVHPQDGRQRPKLSLIRESTEHPLAVEQRDGISFDRLVELYALFGHRISTSAEVP